MITEANEIPAKQTSSMMETPIYNPEAQTLTIRFKSGGVTHQYANFTKEDFDEFISAPSWGKHFRQAIRPRYEGIDTRVKESPEQEQQPS